ncbi:B-cell receptor CD22-like isoform X1 [Perca fluviatilis]|nr:B-cell receptor CD22-like isoform X1 [Perca fluviatilis]
MSIRSEDSGNYYCKSENQHGRINSTSRFIDVLYAPKLPSVSVCPSGKIVEGSSVTLACSSDANPAAKYTWYKNNVDSPKASGQIFIITDFRAEHSGNYYCEAQNRRGRQNSTLHLDVRAGDWILITAGTVTAILIVVILIAAWLWIRKKRARKQPSEPTERPDSAQKQPAEPKDNLHYASVHFSKTQADPLYANTTMALAQKPRREEEVGRVEYSIIKLKNGSTAPGNSSQESGVDPAALYSAVNNPPQKNGYQIS